MAASPSDRPSFDNKCRFRASWRPFCSKTGFFPYGRFDGIDEVLRALYRQATAAPHDVQTGMRSSTADVHGRSAKIPALDTPGNGPGAKPTTGHVDRTLLASLPWLLGFFLVGIAHAGEVTLYESDNFSGRSLTATDTVSNFAAVGFNDRAALAVIARGTWELCSDADFRGRCVTLNPGRYPNLGSMGLDRNISSVREIGGAPVYGGGGESWGGGGNRGRITLYDGPGFAGEPLVSDGMQPNHHDQGFNDRARSMIVLHGQWEVCSDAYYRGACETFGPGRYANLGGLSGQVSSLRLVAMTPVAPPPQRVARAILYEGPDLTGRSFAIDNEVVENFARTGSTTARSRSRSRTASGSSAGTRISGATAGRSGPATTECSHGGSTRRFPRVAGCSDDPY